ncbi:polysaccharide biosynthesis tyrosine autokinase [Alloiococcus sp. CFN-8]|uniref:polysaccharide biosynthesis tyrosine autokinase n=1 Tax=Alloiococcus sp. CFN-8 TaxID=3416081 RepID=UPI003CE8DF68
MEVRNTESPLREFNIDILDILKDIIKNIWVIILFGFIAYMCAYMYVTYTYEPEYTTNTTLVVSDSTAGSHKYSDISTTASLAEVFSNIIDSEILQNRVAEDIGMHSVPGDISVSLINDTNFLCLTVTSSTPRLAYDIINSVMDNYLDVAGYVVGHTVIQLLEEPMYPSGPSNYCDATGTAGKASKLGMLFMLAVVIILSYFKDTVKNKYEVEKKLDARLLGTIYHENKYKTLKSLFKKNRKAVLVSNPIVSLNFVEAYKKIRTSIEYRTENKGVKVILVSSVLENEGKSTVAANIAITLAKNSKKVLLIEGDIRKPSVHKIFQLKHQKTNAIESYLQGGCSYEQLIVESSEKNLFLISGKKHQDNSTELISNGRMKELIEKLRDSFEYIIIDSPPISLMADTEALVEYADASLLVVRQSRALTIDINDAIDVLNGEQGKLLGCIYNDVIDIIDGYNSGYKDYYKNKISNRYNPES